MAHDLNNAFAPMLLALPLLRGAVRSAEGRRLLATVEACAERASCSLRHVLTYAGAVPCERKPVATARFLQETASVLRGRLPPAVSLAASEPVPPCSLRGDAAQLQHALVLLADNAVAAMPSGGVLALGACLGPLPAEAQGLLPAAALPDRMLYLTLADTGTGIAPDVFPRIFEPFAAPPPAAQGSGLGLATVAGIARLHGGAVLVESVPGCGTRVSLLLPAYPPLAAEDSLRSTADFPRAHGELVLVVDDEAPVRDTMRAALEAHGYRVLAAHDGIEALVAYSRHRESLVAVITDMVMPGMDGPALVRGLRHLDPAVPIIGFSGLGDANRLREVEALRLPIFLPKPFTPDRLVAAVQDLRRISAVRQGASHP